MSIFGNKKILISTLPVTLYTECSSHRLSKIRNKEFKYWITRGGSTCEDRAVKSSSSANSTFTPPDVCETKLSADPTTG